MTSRKSKPSSRISVAVSNPATAKRSSKEIEQARTMKRYSWAAPGQNNNNNINKNNLFALLASPQEEILSPMLEEHFRVDPTTKDILPGAPQHDDENWARDAHDVFNLIALIPIVILNYMNWDFDKLKELLFFVGGDNNTAMSIEDAWTDDYFQTFFFTVVAYFVADLTWMIVCPHCVKSPATIYQHHIASMLYLLVPWYRPNLRWCMGACMSVEINTWFLIARRVFNKAGTSPWIDIDLMNMVSIRIKFISVGFYITWIIIRCIVYPVMWLYLIKRWYVISIDIGNPINIELVNPVMQTVFCLLNLKWTYDLINSKIRYYKRKNKGEAYTPDKGL